MPQGRIMSAETNGICFIKFIGIIQYTISSGFDKLVEDIIKSDSVNEVVFDVNEANHIDSTNLGLMARIAGQMIKKTGHKPVIICKNEDIRTLLLSMGFEQAFLIVEKLEITPPELFPLPAEIQQRADQLKMLTEAHRTLMEMNDENREKFKTVVKIFENEVV